MKKNIILKSIALVMIASISESVNATPSPRMSNVQAGIGLSPKPSSNYTDSQLIQKVKDQADNALGVLVSQLENLDPVVRSEAFKTLSSMPEMLQMLDGLSKQGGISSENLREKLKKISDVIEMTVTRMEMKK